MDTFDTDRALSIPLEAELISDERWKQMAPERERDTGAPVFPLDDFDPGWWVVHVSELRWLRMARALAAFWRQHGKRPRSRVDDAAEQKLGQWLQTQRTNLRNKELRSGRQQYLDRVVPGWEQGYDAVWQENADALAAFHKEHGRWPRSRVDDAAEQKLGQWLLPQRTALREQKLRADRQQYLDRVAPGWQGELRDNDAAWRELADALVAFRTEHGRWPSKRADDETERELGQWLGTQRTALREQKLRADRQQYLDRVAPGWQGELRDNDAVWRELADALVAFRTQHGRWPRTEAGDAAERKLGRWLRKQRTVLREDRLRSDRQHYLDRVAPGWEGEGNEVVWRAIADEFAVFREEHGRWPSTTAADDDERRLGNWLNIQRQALRKGKLRDDRKQYLDRVAPGWEGERRDNETWWLANADELAAFRKEHSRWPRKGAGDEAERKLGQWLHNQRTALGKDKLRSDRRQYLDRVLPGWEQGRRR